MPVEQVVEPPLVEKVVTPPRDLEVLPPHLKVVAIAIDRAVQVVIEDLNLKQTFFIEAGPERDHFKIDRVDGKRIFLSYFGTPYIISLGR